MTVTINGTSGITTPGVNSTASNTLGDNVADTLNVGNGTIVTDSSGNVGIGTSSIIDSNFPLELNAAASDVRGMGVNNANGYGVYLVYDNTARYGTGGAAVRNIANSPLAFETNNTERMRIDSSGNLLVGTTSNPQTARMDVKGVSGGGNVLVVEQAAAGGWCQQQFAVNNGGSYYLTQFFAGPTSGAASVGTITSNGSTTTYGTSSDYRLKENIQPMQNALATVAQLNPVTYTWKNTGINDNGFIAHELQAVLPNAVTGEKDAVRIVDVLDDEGRKIGTKEEPVYQGIDTSFLVATLTKAIQELKAEVDDLKAQLEAK